MTEQGVTYTKREREMAAYRKWERKQDAKSPQVKGLTAGRPVV